MGRFTLFDATEFRETLQDEYGVYTHFHDQCGGGFSFSYDESLTEEHRIFIERCFAEYGISLQFSEDNKSFIIVPFPTPEGPAITNSFDFIIFPFYLF